MNNLTNSRKVLGCYMINRTNSSKVDDKSDDSYRNLDGEIPFSPNHEDLFTELPDEILSYIPTHLTLRDVVRMATLSKRWKNIRSLLPNLDLEWRVMSGHKGFRHEDACELYRQAYVTRVNKILQECSNQDISSFHICFCFTKECASHVDHWISFASKKHLESLTLKFVCIDHYGSILQLELQKLLRPEAMYTITSSYLSQFPFSKDLCLSVCILKLHNNFSFNKLVRLDLFHVVLEGDHLQWTLSNFYTIEWLRIRNCNLPKKLCFGDNLQRLSFLMINDISDLQEIELNAKNLKSFEYVGGKVVKLSFLCDAKLEFINVGLLGENYKAAECIFRDMATSLPSLGTLLLEGKYSLIHVFPTHPSTLFRSVVRLSLIFDQEDSEFDMGKSFPCLFNSFPQLQKLYLMISKCKELYWRSTRCLDTNNLSGNIPPNIGNLTHVDELVLSNNALSGPMPDLGGMVSLNYLVLSNIALNGPMPDLGGMLSLNYPVMVDATMPQLVSKYSFWASSLHFLKS